MATLSDLSFPHFRANRRRRFTRKWGLVASGDLGAVICFPDRVKENVQLHPFGFKVSFCNLQRYFVQESATPVVRAASLHVSTTAMSKEIDLKVTVHLMVFTSGSG